VEAERHLHVHGKWTTAGKGTASA